MKLVEPPDDSKQRLRTARARLIGTTIDLIAIPIWMGIAIYCMFGSFMIAYHDDNYLPLAVLVGAWMLNKGRK